MASSAMDMGALLQGTPFRAVARVGAGGMGEIYEAVGPFGRGCIVVKLLRADLAHHAELVERLRREGEMLQCLTHPNIVVAYGHGVTAAGRPYVVMERLVGSTLREILTQRGALPPREAVRYARQLLRALGAVHRAGIVHRDVKPGNVMICPRGDAAPCLKLFDFGVAKIAGDARRLVAPIAFPTREGVCLGTPRYISPEQASGLEVDRRSDIYAAGMLLYTLLAGRGPFDDALGLQDLLEAHIGREPPPPSAFMPLPLPSALEAVVLRAIAKNPEDRFPDAAAFCRELARVSWQGRRAEARAPAVRLGTFARPYARRSSSDRCRIRTVAPPPALPRVRTTRGQRGPAWPSSPSSATSDDTLTVAWDGAPVTRSGRADGFPNGRPPHRAEERVFPGSISRRGVFCSAAAFFAAAGGLAMWFVR